MRHTQPQVTWQEPLISLPSQSYHPSESQSHRQLDMDWRRQQYYVPNFSTAPQTTAEVTNTSREPTNHQQMWNQSRHQNHQQSRYSKPSDVHRMQRAVSSFHPQHQGASNSMAKLNRPQSWQSASPSTQSHNTAVPRPVPQQTTLQKKPEMKRRFSTYVKPQAFQEKPQNFPKTPQRDFKMRGRSASQFRTKPPAVLQPPSMSEFLRPFPPSQLSTFAKKSTSCVDRIRKSLPKKMLQSARKSTGSFNLVEDIKRVPQKKIETKVMHIPLASFLNTPPVHYQIVASLAFVKSPSGVGIVIKCMKSCGFSEKFTDLNKMRRTMLEHFKTHRRDLRWNGYCSSCQKQRIDPQDSDRGEFTLRNELEHIIDCHIKQNGN